MLSTKMNEINEKYALKGMDRKAAQKYLKAEGLPAWCVRQSDLPTYALTLVAKEGNYKPQSVEQFRETNGHLKVEFDGKYWKCSAVLKDAYKESEAGKNCLADFEAMEKGDVVVNTTNCSSERRHCLAIAKAAAIVYQLAFSEAKDVQQVNPKDLQNKERRTDVYKFGSKMAGEAPKETSKPEGEPEPAKDVLKDTVGSAIIKNDSSKEEVPKEESKPEEKAPAPTAEGKVKKDKKK